MCRARTLSVYIVAAELRDGTTTVETTPQTASEKGLRLCGRTESKRERGGYNGARAYVCDFYGLLAVRATDKGCGASLLYIHRFKAEEDSEVLSLILVYFVFYCV